MKQIPIKDDVATQFAQFPDDKLRIEANAIFYIDFNFNINTVLKTIVGNLTTHSPLILEDS